jgi:hypothetical protein
MGSACSIHGVMRNVHNIFSENPQGRGHMGDI